MTNGIGRVGWRNFVSVAPTTASIVTSGLVLNLDAGNAASYSGSGTTWTDLSGNVNNATLVNGTSYSSANGGTMVFDGINDYTNVNGIVTSNSYTISTWCKVDYTNSTYYGRIIEKGLNNEFTLCINKSYPRKYCFQLGGGSNFLESNSLISLIPKYDNVTITIENTSPGQYTGRMYVNGVLETTTSVGATLNNNNIIYIGGNIQFPDLTSLYGNVANTLMYSRALSASEVLQNFDSTKEKFGYPSYTARTQALIVATGLTDTTKINAINTFDLGLISNSIPFGANDALYLGFLGDSDKNKFNFIDTTKYQLTFYGGWDFTNGMKGNSVNTYAKTGWIPSARITNNDGGAMGAYLRNDFGNDQHFMGVGNGGSYFEPYPYQGKIYPSINDGNNNSYTPTRRRGGIDIARTSSTNISCLSDSTTYNVTQNFTGKNGYEVYIGAMSYLGGPYGIYNNDIVCAYISANQWTQSQQLAFSALRSTMLTTLGLNV